MTAPCLVRRRQLLAIAEGLVEAAEYVLARPHRRVALLRRGVAELRGVDDGGKVGIAECRDRMALAPGEVDDAMNRRAEAAARPARQEIADIDDEAAGHRARVDPGPARHAAHLEAAIVVLPEQRDAAVIGMRGDAELVGIAV